MKADEVRKVKLKARPINVKIVTLGKEEQKLIRKWSSWCAAPFREFCTSVLTRLLTYFTSKSVDDLLNEIVRKGLSIEVSLILLSQYDLMNNNDTSIKDYLNTGKTDINLLISILSKNGVNINPEELKRIIELNKGKAKKSMFSLIPGFLKR
ncbi:hypothetical protein [Vulcanisaeta souniana]|uniref:hypothetical protein n=1 Tax=Vulcanisaeta souniana TaxID=164452 RepID=UPI0006CF341B|nr:hypothetical protein [Vulcanisaeta souniana]